MGYIFRRSHCALVKMVKVRERTAVAGRSPVGVTGVLGANSIIHHDEKLFSSFRTPYRKTIHNLLSDKKKTSLYLTNSIKIIWKYCHTFHFTLLESCLAIEFQV